MSPQIFEKQRGKEEGVIGADSLFMRMMMNEYANGMEAHPICFFKTGGGSTSNGQLPMFTEEVPLEYNEVDLETIEAASVAEKMSKVSKFIAYINSRDPAPVTQGNQRPGKHRYLRNAAGERVRVED